MSLALLFLDHAITAMVRVALAITCMLLFLMATVGAADVLALNLFGWSIPIVSEVSADALAVVIFLAIPFAQQQKQHVSVDLVTNLLPQALKRSAGLAAQLVTLCFYILLTWRTGTLAVESWEIKQTAMALFAYTVYPFKIAALAGIFLGTLECLRQIVWSLVGDAEQNDQAAETIL